MFEFSSHYIVFGYSAAGSLRVAFHDHAEEESFDFIKAARVVGEVYGHMEQYRGDEWIEYRIRCLIERGNFTDEGDQNAMRLYQVKLNP